MRKLLLAGVALAVVSMPAMSNPTNFYVGLEGGYRMSDFDVKIPAYGAAGDFGVQPGGFVWGGFAAMTYDLGPSVEFGFQIEGQDVTHSATNPSGGTGGLYQVTENYNLGLSAIVLVDLDPGTKAYVSGGYGIAQADAAFGVAPAQSRTADFSGLIAAVGFTRDIHNGIFMRAQYRYSELGSDSVVHNLPVIPAVVGSSIDMSSHDFSVGLGLAF